jgi:hypothetical protein
MIGCWGKSTGESMIDVGGGCYGGRVVMLTSLGFVVSSCIDYCGGMCSSLLITKFNVLAVEGEVYNRVCCRQSCFT